MSRLLADLGVGALVVGVVIVAGAACAMAAERVVDVLADWLEGRH